MMLHIVLVYYSMHIHEVIIKISVTNAITFYCSLVTKGQKYPYTDL